MSDPHIKTNATNSSILIIGSDDNNITDKFYLALQTWAAYVRQCAQSASFLLKALLYVYVTLYSKAEIKGREVLGGEEQTKTVGCLNFTVVLSPVLNSTTGLGLEIVPPPPPPPHPIC
jgi:hypothetical protein